MKVLCFEIVYVGFGGAWQQLAKSGKVFDAIKAHREQYGTGLREAKDIVCGWMDKKGIKRS